MTFLEFCVLVVVVMGFLRLGYLLAELIDTTYGPLD